MTAQTNLQLSLLLQFGNISSTERSHKLFEICLLRQLPPLIGVQVCVKKFWQIFRSPALLDKNNQLQCKVFISAFHGQLAE